MIFEVLKKQVRHFFKDKDYRLILHFSVGRELQTLHSLRRMFVNDLRARVRRAQVQNIAFFSKSSPLKE